MIAASIGTRSKIHFWLCEHFVYLTFHILQLSNELKKLDEKLGTAGKQLQDKVPLFESNFVKKIKKKQKKKKEMENCAHYFRIMNNRI